MNINEYKFEAIHTNVKETDLNGEDVLNVTKKDKIMEFDENTFAKVNNVNFSNGTIEVKVLSRLLNGAPDFARGFIGIAYHINEDNTKFESFYIRPTNGNVDDKIRQNRAIQYFSYPGYTFDYFRENGITDYEGKANIDLDEWIMIRAEIENEKATFYVKDMETPVLVVEEMFHKGKSGTGVGLLVDIGTDGFFKDLIITQR